jgi:segregation and condensation protein B
MQIEQLKPIIEAALLAASQPLGVVQLGDLFVEEDAVDREQIAKALEALAADCEGRGIELKEVASGFRYQVRQQVHPWISRMWTEKPSRYSRALLETLALIAYRQPITRPEIEQIRGVVVSSSIVKTLEEREWIRVVGHRDVPGRPALFGTTRAFLDYFNLKSLDELPPLSEIRDMEDPQLRFDQEPMPVRVARDLPIDPDEIASDAILPDGIAPNGTASNEIAPDEESAAPEETSASTDGSLTEAAGEPDIASIVPSAADFADDSEAATATAGREGPTAGTEPADNASDEDAHTIPPVATADEAAPPADAEPDAAEQDTEEYRA